MPQFSVSHRRALLLAGALVVPSATAFAQDAAPAPAPAEANAPAPGEIVVTARFRNESLQQVPIAISAVSGQSLNDRGIHNLQDLSASVPTVDFRSGASNKDRTVFIRGVGTITTSPGVESSVSTVLDGVVLNRPGQATLDVGEVERIEVLRGPQGTLFGKNASAGVINIVTAAPSQQFHAYVEGGATTDAEYRVKAGVTGGLTDTVSARIDGLYANYKGNVWNAVTKDKVNGYERYGLRGKIEARPSDALTLTLAGDWLHSYDTTSNGVYASTSQIAYPTNAVTPSPTLVGILNGYGITAGPANRTAATSFNTDVRDENFGASLTADLSLGDYKLTSITAWRGWKNHQHQDLDATQASPAVQAQSEDHGDVNTNQYSQELRLTSPKGKLIDYVVGAYVLRAETDERYQRDLTRTSGVATGVANYGIRANNYALFGEANLNFTSSFRAIAGYRSTWDKLSYYHVRTSTNDPNNTGNSALAVSGIRAYHNSNGSTSTRGDSWRLGLQWDVSPHAQVYGTWSRGYKGPAYNAFFNMQATDEIALAPETSDSFEVGIKGSTTDRSVRYAIAAYTTTFKNYQANVADLVNGTSVTRLINAGKVRSQGIEADVTLVPTKGFTVDLSAAYDDAKVVNFNCPAGLPASCDINGKPLPFAPKVKLFANAAYRFALTQAVDLELQSDIAFKSETQYQLTQTPGTIQPAYAIWNGSVALLGSDDGWQVRAYVKNITNTHYASYLVNGGVAGIVRYVPRDDVRYGGVTLRKTF
ncbi:MULTISPECIES: TonB-dependent receptor [unclassified Novosphingobium]|uniref:TonB-dependent receptor n=1 Tax=unclassified Novosphingobium TaxID=2644732 RepID=UPI00146CCB59|nr:MULTISPECIES: TonB-dependent receptor [unclassified Novosphingobium]NMN04503.1 iron complex outermembrane receptor protein [Novosphingobium sp. SG919]NMN85505.1 iron complex outermembrane receptor protein [Novosphingobium sp. SG916]